MPPGSNSTTRRNSSENSPACTWLRLSRYQSVRRPTSASHEGRWSCSRYGRVVTTTAPSTAPSREAMPPMKIIVSSVIDSVISKLSVLGPPDPVGVQAAGDGGDGAADGERVELPPGDVDAADGRGLLALPKGPPGEADAGPLEEPAQQVDDPEHDEQGEEQRPARRQVERAQLEQRHDEPGRMARLLVLARRLTTR